MGIEEDQEVTELSQENEPTEEQENEEQKMEIEEEDRIEIQEKEVPALVYGSAIEHVEITKEKKGAKERLQNKRKGI